MKNISNKLTIDPTTYILMFIALLSGLIKNTSIILLIVLIHELGHVFFFCIFKLEVESITIYPFGGVTKVNKKIHERIYKDILISLGGVMFQIILWMIFYYLYETNIIVSSTYELFIKYNTGIILFNLLPIVPLDGSKLLMTILSKYLPYKKCLKYQLVICALSLIIFISYIVKNGIDDIIVVTYLISEIYKLYKNNKYILNRFYLERIIYNNYYNGIKNSDNIDDMRLDKYYFFEDGQKYIREEKFILKKKF